jgi:hypothetical protein
MARVDFAKLKVGDILEFETVDGEQRWTKHQGRIRALVGWDSGEFVIEFWPDAEVDHSWRHGFMEREFGEDTRPNRIGHLPLNRKELDELTPPDRSAFLEAHQRMLDGFSQTDPTWKQTRPHYDG